MRDLSLEFGVDVFLSAQQLSELSLLFLVQVISVELTHLLPRVTVDVTLRKIRKISY